MHEEYFFKKYYGFVMGIGRSYVKSEDLAQEIVQDAFLKFFDSVDKLEQNPVILPWLRRIAVNTAIDYYRKNQKFKLHEEADGNRLLVEQENAIEQLGYHEIWRLGDSSPPIVAELHRERGLVVGGHALRKGPHNREALVVGVTQSDFGEP
jgi:RNA polymerase sigma factor (sigma-70 family)